MTSRSAQTTDFSRDVIGRYVCNGLDEALASATPTGSRADARPFDVIVVGGGSFGPIFAEHLFAADVFHSHRVLVLEAGPLSVPEHVQNLPMIGLNVPPPSTGDPGLRNEVWGLPWRSQVAFPGLAYTVGGRSVFFGGWAPELLQSETTAWPQSVLDDLRNPRPDGSPSYFRQAAEQIGVTQTNDFIFGPMHEALRARLFDGINAGLVTDAIPLDSPDLPFELDNIALAERPLNQLEAPLAVQARAPRPGFFPFNKFSAVPLLMQAARSAASESGGDDVKKRFMIVPNCHVVRLVTEPTATGIRVAKVLTSQGLVPVPDGGIVVIASGTIESTRLALTSFPNLPNESQLGANLMAHLRSNVTIRIPVSSLPPGLGNELATSALFVKGRHTFADGTSVGHFHLQITAAGLATPSTDSEAELFKKNPDIDLFERFLHTTDTTVVITIRGIGEMQPDNPQSGVTRALELDEYGLPRAWVALVNPAAPPAVDDSVQTSKDRALWDAMDLAADQVAQIFASGAGYEVLAGARGFVPVAAGAAAATVLPFGQRRDGVGTTHHEAGTLRMGDDPTASVTDPTGRFHYVDNAYALGPALHPSVGSPNPMLTGTALARRLADSVATGTPFLPDAGFTSLFDGANTSTWRMSTIINQPGRDDPGHFLVVDGSLETVTGSDLGMLWCTVPTPVDFVLRLQWRRWSEDANSGVFLRFPDPNSLNYNNTAFVAVNRGFEIQIDQQGNPDGASIHRTGAVYGFAGPQTGAVDVRPVGVWNDYEIRVQGQHYQVILNGAVVTEYDNPDPARGQASATNAPAFIGLQTHTGRVGFRHLQIRPF